MSAPATGAFTLPFAAVSAQELSRVGGKGANLGELTRAGFPVPPGFCITTAAFDAFAAGCAQLPQHLDRLEALDGRDVVAARDAAEAIRVALADTPIPSEVARSIAAALREAGAEAAYAVRSSATAEDLPDASFAGQQDTYLNVRGEAALLEAVRRCWASLFTERAVLYRARSGFRHRDVKLAVVVQRMVLPDVSGILFTADPINGSRRIVSIEAGFGLGEALVSGVINADLYRVDKASSGILEVRPGDKAFAIRPRPEGGTSQEPLGDAQRNARCLEDAAVRALTELGVRIERHYGTPQDIEWCIEQGQIFIVQARPITHLFPLPEPAPQAGALHAYVSFGHVQMMTDAMPALARQVWRLLLPFGRPEEGFESRVVTSAASRIFLDLTPALRHPALRRVVPALLGRVYPDLGLAIQAMGQRVRAAEQPDEGRVRFATVERYVLPVLARVIAGLLWADPSRWVRDAGAFSDDYVDAARERLGAARAGAERLREVTPLLAELFERGFLFVASRIPAGLLANGILHRLAARGLIRADDAELTALERGLPGNVTTQMDLAVGDLIDRARENPEVLALMKTRPPHEALTEIREVETARDFVMAWDAFMERYGMRGPGEVDLSRPRYRDDPRPLIATILGGVDTAREAGEHRARHQNLASAADAAAERILSATRRGPLGALGGWWTRRLIRVARAGMALREHPKFLLVRVLDLVRGALREAGLLLVQRRALERVEDVFLFELDELIAALEKRDADLRQVAGVRRAALKRDGQRIVPFAMASDGEIPMLAARTDLPAGVLSGTAASAGVVEGRARVVLDPSEEVLHDGEILVAPHTDPGWTPLFIHAAGLVTEVGGLITHGSVVAREYGIPAVVSVAGATQRIRTGQRIRVDGTRGTVEILDEERS